MLAGTIRVGVVQSLGSYFLPLVIPDLHIRYPDLRLYVREGLADDLVRRLEEGSLDLLFFPLPVTGSEFAVARLFREPLLAVAAVDHPIAQLDRVPPERLAGERILTLETGHRLHDQVRRISEETGAEISLDYGATSLDTIRQMVAMNLGISLLPALYVRSEVQPNQMVTSRPLQGPQPFRAVGMVWRAGRAWRRLPRTRAGHPSDPAPGDARSDRRRLSGPVVHVGESDRGPNDCHPVDGRDQTTDRSGWSRCRSVSAGRDNHQHSTVTLADPRVPASRPNRTLGRDYRVKRVGHRKNTSAPSISIGSSYY
jgi:hypothetical protein